MLKLWGRGNSINVQKVIWCCEELGVPFERVDVGGPFGGNRDPEFLALNPNGLVPAITESDFSLWESNAIVRYVSARHGSGTLWPENLEVRAEADKWMDWQMGTVWASFRPVFLGLVRTPPEERNEEEIEAGVKGTADAMRILDSHLAAREHVAGSEFTMGDIPLGVTLHRWFALDIERPALPNVEAYFERLSERPAYEANVMLPLT